MRKNRENVAARCSKRLVAGNDQSSVLPVVCTTHLGKTLDRWASTVDQKSGTPIHAITLDMKKAFDRVPHGRFVDKLSHHDSSGTMLRWTESFLHAICGVRSSKVRLYREVESV
jgi:hypothetical protein